MAFIGNKVYDDGLNLLNSVADASHFHLCSSLPTTYAAVLAASLGKKPLLPADVSNPAAALPNGRQVTIAALTNIQITTTGTASHYAIVDEVDSVLQIANTLAANESVTQGGTVSTSSFTIRIPESC